MGRRNHTKGQRAKAIIAALAVVIAGVLSGSALVLAGGHAQAATTETPQPCTAGTQLVESVVPLASVNEAICLPTSEQAADGSRVDPNYTRAATVAIAEAARLIDGVEAGDVTVICWSRDDWTQIAEWFEAKGNDRIRTVFGFVSVPSTVVNLSPATCKTLDAIVYAGERPTTMTASKVPVHAELDCRDRGELHRVALGLALVSDAERVERLVDDDADGVTEPSSLSSTRSSTTPRAPAPSTTALTAATTDAST